MRQYNNRGVVFGLILGLGLIAQGLQSQQSGLSWQSRLNPAQSEPQNEVAQDSVAQGAEADNPGAEAGGNDIVASNVRVAVSKDGLFVSMILDVENLKVRNDQEYYYTPSLTGEGHKMDLPPVLIAGRTPYYRHLRSGDLEHKVQLYDGREMANLGHIHYRVNVPFEPWMEKATLQAGNETYPVEEFLQQEKQELHALSLATGLATAMALTPEQQANLSNELKDLTLTPEMQELLAKALETVGKNPDALAQATENLKTAAEQPQQKAETTGPVAAQQASEDSQPVKEPQAEQSFRQQSPEGANLSEVSQPGQQAAAEQPAGNTSDLAHAIGALGLPNDTRNRLMNEIQGLQMSHELKIVLVTALQNMAKTEAFLPVFVYRTPTAEQQKMRSQKGTAHIEFRLNETGIDPSFRRNQTELSQITNTIASLKNDADYTLKSITLKGYASPEGPYDGNAALASARMESVKSHINALIKLPAGKLTADYEAEDWEGLQTVLKASSLQHKDEILKIIADTRLTPDAREWKIKTTYKDDYAYMFNYMYPALRHVDYTVEYEVRAYSDPAEIVQLLATQPQKLSLEEMYSASLTMEEGSEAYNEVFETAVRMYPADETANLNAANSAMRWRDLSRAERYLNKAGQSVQAIYARGNHAALSGNYEMAENFFRHAAGKGLKEATAAMEQIRKLKAESASKGDNNTGESGITR